MRGLSRRAFLGGTAGLSAAAILGQSKGARAATVPLMGATIDNAAYHVNNAVTAANIFDGYVGLPMGTALQKIYLTARDFPTTPSVKMTQLATVGCQFLVAIKPTKEMKPFEINTLKHWLAMMQENNISFRVILYAEANDRAFPTQEEWLTYWQFYAPTIKAANVPLCYDPGCNPSSMLRAESYFPTDPAPDELWMDFYATSFRGGTRLDPLIAQAQTAGVPAGLAEWGWHAGPGTLDPMVMPWWNYYCNYLSSLAGQGSLPLGAVYFDSAAVRDIDIIASSQDPRIPGIQKLAAAVQSG